MEKRSKAASHKPVKITLTGPESTGKTTLCEKLADYFRTIWSPEFARAYLVDICRPYDYPDIEWIARVQFAQEQYMLKQADNLLFCDTDLLVTLVWSKFKYNKVHPWIERSLMKHPPDLYLLCDIDMPWRFDPLREHSNKREEIMAMYMRELEKRALPYIIINGRDKIRFHSAADAVSKLLQSRQK